jgi:hypothetical protein
MKHAGEQALDQLAPLLAKLRAIDGLKEKKRGVFYVKSSAFLHFHEDPTGLFADLRTSARWLRLPVSTRRQQNSLLVRVKAMISRGRGTAESDDRGRRRTRTPG